MSRTGWDVALDKWNSCKWSGPREINEPKSCPSESGHVMSSALRSARDESPTSDPT